MMGMSLKYIKQLIFKWVIHQTPNRILEFFPKLETFAIISATFCEGPPA
jgi:hypothetical protein